MSAASHAGSKETRRELEGVLPVFQTPYHEDETIDFATLDNEIHWLYEKGADGIVMAMVSEVLRLADDERQKLAEHVCRHGREGGVVVISVGAESAFQAEQFARHAEASGADAVMAIPPVSINCLEGDIRWYYERVIRAIDIPMIVQDASGYVGQPLSIDLQAELLAEFGDRVLFKPEAAPIGPRLSALRDATDSQARVFEGTGGIALVDSYRRGVVGTMPGADLIEGIVALWRALQAGDEELTYQLSLPISSLVAVQSSLDSFLAVEKYLLVKQGIFKNTIVRGPRDFDLDEETRREVDRLFDRVTAALRGRP